MINLQRLKTELGYRGDEMAELASVVGGQQWRKYTGGAESRDVGLLNCAPWLTRCARSEASSTSTTYWSKKRV